MVQDQHVERSVWRADAISYCRNYSRFHNSASYLDYRAALAELREWQAPYAAHLMACDFSEQEAYDALDSTFSFAADIFRCYDTQKKLLVTASCFPYSSSVFRLLPALTAMYHAPTDIGSLMTATTEHSRQPGEVAKYAMRYLPAWEHVVTAAERDAIMRNFAGNKDAVFYLAIHIDRLEAHFADDSQLLRHIHAHVEKHGCILPALAFTSVPELPQAQQQAERIAGHGGRIKSDKTRPVRHIDNYAGQCADMGEFHFTSLLCPGDKNYGRAVLLYVDDQPVGMLKMAGDSSVLGLHTVEDHQGRLPIVAGGVYGTSQEVIDAATRGMQDGRRWGRLDLADLPLFPIGFVWQNAGWPLDETESVKRIHEVREWLHNASL